VGDQRLLSLRRRQLLPMTPEEVAAAYDAAEAAEDAAKAQ
jgi:hypothetical protein